MTSEREDWIDYAKGLGIFLVVYGHVIQGLTKANLITTHSVYQDSVLMIYTFHMALFFLVSGFVTKPVSKDMLREFVRNKFQRLMYPYFIWSTAMVGAKTLFSNFINQPLKLENILQIGWKPVDMMWFLYTLFLCFVLKALFDWSYSFFMIPFSSLLLVALCFGLFENEILVHLTLNLPFFCLGVLLQNQVRPMNPRVNITSLGASVLIFFLIVCTPMLINMHWVVRSLIQGVFGCNLLIQIAIFLANCGQFSLIRKLGVCSFAIYLMHGYFATGARLVMAPYLPSFSLPCIILMVLFALTLPLVISQAFGASKIGRLLGITAGSVRKRSSQTRNSSAVA